MELPGTNRAANQASQPVTLEDFGSLDTRAKRPAIAPKDFFALENWMPIGPGNMRTLFGHNTTPIYTAPNPRTILTYAFYNIESTRYAVVFLDNGTAYQVNVDTLAVTTISSTSNTFYAGSGAYPAVAQWEAKYLLIASQRNDNAYWCWDGSRLFTLGTLAPQITITNSGGFFGSVPTVTAYGGSGSGATFLAEIDSLGNLVDVTVTNPGTGYDHEDLVTLIISGGGADTPARATATVSTSSGGVGLALVTAGGNGYSRPQVTFSGGGGSGAAAIVSGMTNGVVTDITITRPGVGYTSPPTIAITDTGGGPGTGATAIAQIAAGQITAITINSGGTGYVGQPDVVISRPNNRQFPSIQAEAYATLTAGVVTGITITNNGVGYQSASVQLSGGNNSAEATAELMPAGIQGSSIEVYQERAWVGDDTKLSHTAAGSIRDFSAANGGGSKPIVDSNLKKKLIALRAANGFLYRFGDSSINVISNVQTDTDATTTFNDSNVDPQIGTAWRETVVAFGRALVFANPVGVYALFGGSAEKVSGQLDGLFEKASFNTGVSGKTPTACIANVFGIRVYCLLFTTTDPFTNTLRDVICCWDGQRWFIYTPNLARSQIAGQLIDSEATGYVATTTAIHEMFATASTAHEKIFSTKLLALAAYIMTSQNLNTYFIAQDNSGEGGTVTITVDTERGFGASKTISLSELVEWQNDALDLVEWENTSPAIVTWSKSGLTVAGFEQTNYGQLIGATVRTNMKDVTWISLTQLIQSQYSQKA